jgi:hypothetical protein
MQAAEYILGCLHAVRLKCGHKDATTKKPSCICIQVNTGALQLWGHACLVVLLPLPLPLPCSCIPQLPCRHCRSWPWVPTCNHYCLDAWVRMCTFEAVKKSLEHCRNELKRHAWRNERPDSQHLLLL